MKYYYISHVFECVYYFIVFMGNIKYKTHDNDLYNVNINTSKLLIYENMNHY